MSGRGEFVREPCFKGTGSSSTLRLIHRFVSLVRMLPTLDHHYVND